MFQHKVQTKTDAMRLFRTFDDLQQWSKDNPDVKIIKGNHDTRTGVTTWNVPQWDKVRADYCSAKLATIKRYGSNQKERFVVVDYFEDDCYPINMVYQQQKQMMHEFDCRCEDCGEGMDEDDLVCPSCGELAGFDLELKPETRNDFQFQCNCKPIASSYVMLGANRLHLKTFQRLT